MDDELCVYDLVSKRCHVLNKTAALVWQQCDGNSTVADIAARLEQAGLPSDEDVVLLAIDQLEKEGLLEEGLPKAPGAARVSRRSVVSKLGVVGAAAALLPLVESIATPTPVCGTSKTPPCTSATA